MSDSEEENYCFFGKPLQPYDDDAFPKKKPISVEDQIATDAQGRRRFHGAFTGGFSAGFYNTVGSLEGWTPSEFKSTRQDKAQNKSQKPEDFMDDEDIGEFGIAPQTVRATSDYSTSKKRKRQAFSDGPIPGEPVLHSLLTSGNETIGYLLLKNIGLKDRTNVQEQEVSSEDKVYGCEMPKTYEISRNDDINQYVIPDIYKEFLQKPKDNSFGLGYVGLDKSHVNLFTSSKLVIRERNKKKVSISGQAFGVGAFEDDDEDIYVKDDMSKYDFELTSEKMSKKESLSKNEETVFDDFIISKNLLPPKDVFLPPTIPHSFTGKHKVKRSRFEPLPLETETPDRKDMNPEVRAKYLGEPTNTTTSGSVPSVSNNASTPGSKTEAAKCDTPKEEDKKEEDLEANTQKKFNLFSVSATDLVFDRFVSASKPEDPSNILEVIEKTETTHGTQEMRDAARMKMFGPLTRISADWQPSSLLCKRFNVPEPHVDELNASRNKKRTRNLIFEYEKFSDASSDLKPGLTIKESEEETVKNDTNEVIETEESSTAAQPNTDEPAGSKEGDKTEESIEEAAPKDITEKIDVNKNIDLFKAVFLSSSESEGEEDEKEKTNKDTEMKSSVLSDNLLPKIKPLKEGILSNMDFSIFEKSNDSNKEINVEDSRPSSTNVIPQTGESSYGPSLPEKLTSKSTDQTVIKYDDNDSDEWVEKPARDKKNKSSHKKKHKNKKSSHKKKHKHSKQR
jgi:G patch domain-containing protein 1